MVILTYIYFVSYLSKAQAKLGSFTSRHRARCVKIQGHGVILTNKRILDISLLFITEVESNDGGVCFLQLFGLAEAMILP